MSHGPPCAVLPLLVDHQWKTSFCPCGVDPWLSVAQRHWDDFCRCAPLLLATTGGFATGSVQRACLCVASLTCLQVSILLANLVRAQTYVLRMDRPLVESTIRGNSPRSSIYFFFPQHDLRWMMLACSWFMGRTTKNRHTCLALKLLGNRLEL